MQLDVVVVPSSVEFSFFLRFAVSRREFWLGDCQQAHFLTVVMYMGCCCCTTAVDPSKQ